MQLKVGGSVIELETKTRMDQWLIEDDGGEGHDHCDSVGHKLGRRGKIFIF